MILGGAFLACSAGKDGRTFGGGNNQVDATGGAGGAGGAGQGTGNDDFDPVTTGGDGTECFSVEGDDADEDGFLAGVDDCNDCDANVNPGAVEVGTDPNDPEAVPADENCNGDTDEPLPPCDDGIALNDLDPMSGARALNVCQTEAADGFGVVSASYMRANGVPATPTYQVGIIDTFGPNVPPRHGSRMLGLSSGRARSSSHPDNCGALTCSIFGAGTPPPGYPQDVSGCPGGTNINDDVALELQLKAPSNANGMTYEFTFYSFEYPEWVCTSYNDQYIALVDPAPMGSLNGNISFDTNGNPVSVNIAFFQVCNGCALGTAELQGTGFDVWNDAGATSWLVTTAPVDPGSTFKIRFAIWDTGDSAWDSTVLVDNFSWIASAGTIQVETIPVPE